MKCFNLGGEDYISKPFLPEVVKARIGLHLKLYETNRELTDTNRLLQTSVGEQIECIEKEKEMFFIFRKAHFHVHVMLEWERLDLLFI